MRRMNVKAGRKSNGKSLALSRHKHFKGDCNDAPRKAAKRDINNELKLIYPLALSSEPVTKSI